jgi:hypothetical protein
MQAYEGYLDKGQFIPIGKPVIFPNKRRVILTVFDEPVEEKNVHAEAWHEFLSAIKNIKDEPVPEFERIKLREIEI